jgi:hypothetical protein
VKIKNGNGNERKTEERGRRKRKVREGEVVAGVCTFKYILNHVVVRLLLFKEMTTRYCVLCVLHTHVSCFCWCRDVVSSFIFVQHPSTIFYIYDCQVPGFCCNEDPDSKHTTMPNNRACPQWQDTIDVLCLKACLSLPLPHRTRNQSNHFYPNVWDL